MKLLLIVFSFIFAVVVLAGCRFHSIIDLQNPEFPLELSPSDVVGELFDKYSVGDVIVEPQIQHGMTQERFHLSVTFASKSDAIVTAVEKVLVSVNGESVSYESFVGKPCSGWIPYPNEPFFVCGVDGPEINPPQVEMTKARVDVSLVVSVKDESGKVTQKQIDTYFIPKKRSYLE